MSSKYTAREKKVYQTLGDLLVLEFPTYGLISVELEGGTKRRVSGITQEAAEEYLKFTRLEALEWVEGFRKTLIKAEETGDLTLPDEVREMVFAEHPEDHILRHTKLGAELFLKVAWLDEQYTEILAVKKLLKSLEGVEEETEDETDGGAQVDSISSTLDTSGVDPDEDAPEVDPFARAGSLSVKGWASSQGVNLT